MAAKAVRNDARRGQVLTLIRPSDMPQKPVISHLKTKAVLRDGFQLVVMMQDDETWSGNDSMNGSYRFDAWRGQSSGIAVTAEALSASHQCEWGPH